ncbi:MAG TPA: thioesterase [Thioploca sp.]|nr:MAG: thioesterase [Gammaproteobacteria bacterium]HDN26581.1 thioesterase [Thioploca sp.]
MNTDKQKITLYCLHFAGGNALSLRHFQAHVADFVHVRPLDLPGRGKRVMEPLLTNAESMVDDVFHQIQDDIKGKPYAIYGHSMGALLGHLLTKHILSVGLPAPVHLFVSGREAPSVVCDKPDKHCLPKQQFIATLNELGGSPPELLEDAALMDFFEPILRADFKAIETFVYNPTQPFDIPITVMHGLKDGEVTHAELLPWQQETRQPISINKFAGGHFFIFDYLPQMGQLFSQTLAQALRNSP